MCIEDAAAPRRLEESLERRVPLAPWRGVNLGGWLLLEPGPAKALFSRHKENGVEPSCEWDLMQILHRKGATDEIDKHRQTYLSKADFQQIRSCGLNAVRLPFGYWCVLPPGDGEPYVGPALEYIDQAIAWAAECGLQVVLDLHGAPGGESADAPSGRRQDSRFWQWSSWRFDESLRALDVLAKRYRDCHNVTGIEVCNEPSSTVPTQALCRFYAQAVATIREAGMSEDRVAVILPVFQRPKAHFAKAWQASTGGAFKNVAFDFHYYHCFGSKWDGRTFAQHLRAVERHAAELRRLPAVVGEWSLALGRAARSGRLSGEEARALFGRLQMEAYGHASHGWFFWNWKDAHGTEWSWQLSYQESALRGPPPALPSWDGRGEDPLEEVFDPSPPDRNIRINDAVALRSYHGRHLSADEDDSMVDTSHCVDCSDDRGETSFVICGHGLPPGSPIVDGSTVRLRTPGGSFLVVDEQNGRVLARHLSEDTEDPACVFIVHVVGGGQLQHRGSAYFQSLATFNMVHVHGGLHALWDHCGDWQRFVVEKKRSAWPVLAREQTRAADVLACPRSPSPARVREHAATPPFARIVSSATSGELMSAATPQRASLRGSLCPNTPRKVPREASLLHPSLLVDYGLLQRSKRRRRESSSPEFRMSAVEKPSALSTTKRSARSRSRSRSTASTASPFSDLSDVSGVTHSPTE